jgi:hypothetical protein
MQLRQVNRRALPCRKWKVQCKAGEERGKNRHGLTLRVHGWLSDHAGRVVP